MRLTRTTRGPLPHPIQALTLAANLVFGLGLSLAFFVWIERNCTLPYLARIAEWPWISPDWGSPGRVIFDTSLILIFGFFHSLLAQTFAQKALAHWLPVQILRTFYVCVTGLLLLGVMALWQGTGLILWVLPLSQTWTNALSVTLFWAFCGAAFLIIRNLDALRFVGLKQIGEGSSSGKTEGVVDLCSRGVYSWVRHPVYLFTLLAFLVTPMMSLDRFTVFAASVLYLTVAIPIEERKLVAQWGSSYIDYRRHVPAIVPVRLWPFRGRAKKALSRDLA